MVPELSPSQRLKGTQRGFSYGENPLKSESRCKSRWYAVGELQVDLLAFVPVLTLPSRTPLMQSSAEERGAGMDVPNYFILCYF